jgi:alpha-L-rhamnosidase
MEEPWSAKWIACGKGDRHPVFSRDLDQASASLASGKRVAGARLYISGLGLYEAYLNGGEDRGRVSDTRLRSL